MSAADTTRKGGRGRARANGIAGERLWKSRSVETQKQGFHCAWESRKKRGIPTFPQPRRRRPIKLKPDISCATKTGHFNLLTTGELNKIAKPRPPGQLFGSCAFGFIGSVATTCL